MEDLRYKNELVKFISLVHGKDISNLPDPEINDSEYK